MEESARAVLLSPDGRILLMSVRGSAGSLWITPGGRLEAGESPREALSREVREETGLRADVSAQAEIWVRIGTYRSEGVEALEKERFFLVRLELEFQPTPGGMEAAEAGRFVEFRWWSQAEIAESRERFVPRELADLLSSLLTHGPPLEPILIEE